MHLSYPKWQQVRASRQYRVHAQCKSFFMFYIISCDEGFFFFLSFCFFRQACIETQGCHCGCGGDVVVVCSRWLGETVPTLHPIVPKLHLFYVYDVIVFSNSFKTTFSHGARLLEDFRAIIKRCLVEDLYISL